MFYLYYTLIEYMNYNYKNNYYTEIYIYFSLATLKQYYACTKILLLIYYEKSKLLKKFF